MMAMPINRTRLREQRSQAGSVPSPSLDRRDQVNISGSVVLLTGANGGIGHALRQELVNRGAAKIYLAARNISSLAPLLEGSDRLVPLTLDVTKPDQVAAVAKAATDITLLINNAGVANFTGALSAKDTASARQEMDVNYFGILELAQALRGTAAFRSGGAIVNVLSFLSLVTLPVAGTYSASKAAALALTRTLRAELKPRGVQVLGVMPVQVDTVMGQALPEPRLTPVEVAIGTLDALEAGGEDVFPGALSQGAADMFRTDPAGMQAHMAGMVHAID
jgi:short-subunit dehydrogenase